LQLIYFNWNFYWPSNYYIFIHFYPNFDKSQEGSSSEDIQQQLTNEHTDASSFLQSLTQNIGKPEYITTTIFEENEEKVATSEDEEQIDEFERENSENVISEFEFTQFEQSPTESPIEEPEVIFRKKLATFLCYVL